MNPTSKPLTVTVHGERLTFYFDLNTFSAFEEVTKTFFFDFLGRLEQSFRQHSQNGRLDGNSMLGILRQVSLAEVRGLIWAALHTYDRDDNPEWPYTLNQIGRMLDVSNIGELLPQLLRASSENMPAEDEVERPQKGEKIGTPSPRGNGGPEFGPSDEEILASMTAKSES